MQNESTFSCTNDINLPIQITTNNYLDVWQFNLEMGRLITILHGEVFAHYIGMIIP